MRAILSLVSFPIYYSLLCEKYWCRDQQQSLTICPGAAVPCSCVKKKKPLITAAARQQRGCKVGKNPVKAQSFDFQRQDGFNTNQIKYGKKRSLFLCIIQQFLINWIIVCPLWAGVFVFQINLQLTLETTRDFRSLLLY